MKTTKSLWNFLFLDFGEYPKIELQNKNVLAKQFANIEKFKVKRFCLYAATLLLLLEFLIISLLVEFYGADPEKGPLVDIFLPLVFITMFFLVIFGVFFKCPNCGTNPKSRSLSFGSEISYGKGINPFPKRCECCGFYLSRKALLKDVVEKETDKRKPSQK